MIDANTVPDTVQTGSLPDEPESPAAESLGVFAHQAIRKHFKKTIKYKSQVLADQDPEPLHQMRVGIRRLRSALETFDHAIDLTAAPAGSGKSHLRSRPSPGIDSRNLAKLAKRLGAVRDLDVLLMWLQTYCQETELSASEGRALKKVRTRLHKQRRKAFRQMRQWLNSKRYQTLTVSFKAWIDEPRYRALAQVPIQLVLPDLLMPLLAEVLQHPAWLAGTLAQSGVVVPDFDMDSAQISQCLAEQGTVLHDLRKRIKHVRYQTEFFLDMHGPAYAAQVQEFRQLQDILGALQDEVVIGGFLAKTLGDAWPKRLPALAQQFGQERLTLWQQWQSIQARYLDISFRHTLRMQLLSVAG